MEYYLGDYLTYLRDNRQLKRNSLAAHQKEALRFMRCLEKEGLSDIRELLPSAYSAYLEEQRKEMSPASFNRLKSCMRSYLGYLNAKGRISSYDSFIEITDRMDSAGNDGIIDGTRQKTGLPEKNLPQDREAVLSYGELKALFEAPDTTSFTGIRDRAILELMYAAALRPDEILGIRVSDLDLQMGFVVLHPENASADTVDDYAGSSLMAYYGDRTRKALGHYLRMMRGFYTSGEDTLFVNQNGYPMSRQALWKLILKHGVSAGIDRPVTAGLIRKSFAVHLMENGADVEQALAVLRLKDERSLKKLTGNVQNKRKKYLKKAQNLV